MTKKLDNEGLRAIVNEYDLFFIDIWGVIHDGIKLHKEAIKTLDKIEEAKKDYVLLTNAPRPNATVKIFLNKMGMNKDIQEKVYTSGEAALNYLLEIPIMSDSFIILNSLPSIFTSVPDHLPKRTLSPTFTSIGIIFPSSVFAPPPTATTLPS